MSFTRRRLLAGLASSIVVAPFMSRVQAQSARFDSNPFTLGVASGDPDATSVVLWTRLAPAPLERNGGMPSAPVTVDWELAEDDKMQKVVHRGTATALPAEGHSVHIVAEGLSPNRPYWYRFTAGGAESRIGRTRTLPAQGVIPDSFRLAVAGCQRIEEGYFTAWGDIARSDVDLVFHYGDYIYEFALPANSIESRMGRNVPNAVRQKLSDLSDYRLRYALYKLDPDLAAAHAAHPFVASFDDHEVSGNWGGLAGRGKITERELLKLRAAGFQAFYENSPVRPSVRPRESNITAYRSFDIGGLLRLAALDTRQFRSMPACGKVATQHCDKRLAPDRSMIGADQERWLLDLFARNDTTWTVLGNQVMMMQRRVKDPAKDIVNTDKWDGNPAARTRILQGAADRKVTGLVTVTGDIHRAFAGNLKVDFDNAGAAPIGVELVASSISSGGDAEKGKAAAALKRLIRANPHFRFYDDRRGYVACTFAKDRCEAVFRAVESVAKPNAPMSTIKTFEFEPVRQGLA